MIALLIGLLATYGLLRRAGCDTLLVRTWCLIWGVSAAGALVLEDRPWWTISAQVPVLCGIALCLGAGSALAGGRVRVAGTSDAWASVLSVRAHRYLLLSCMAISFLSVLLLLRDLGLGVGVFANTEELVAAAGAAAVARYHEDFNPEPVTRLLLVFVYLSGLLAGWYIARPIRGVSRPLLCLLAFLPALMWTALLTSKANVLFWIAFTVSAWLVFGASDRRLQRSHRLWWGLASGAAALAVLLFAVQVSRYGGDLQVAGQDATDALAVAAVGHVFALREWLDRGIPWWPDGMGVHTFAGLAELLGATTREIGLYGDQVAVGRSETNVYTVLRPLMEDFGALLTFCGFAVAGWLATRLDAMAAGRAGASAALSVMLAALCWSPITSLFAYNSLLVSCGLFLAFAALLPTSKALGKRAEAVAPRL